ncbi:GNAT family N-acetyltransferase [Phenylobacterium aquaticum]|uniref:GNAT family N-acetyltransferase n=1 Tax=Phenylobacterium aquaticum TaxID=1763816 RepID=UPI001F5E1D2C|nr:GNAT family N-acetyltransferase [Phenylobacterium aquaticum]MCI3132529.1 GNAT family N-acetyltransferase [Phenylobacterium aquaticum]
MDLKTSVREAAASEAPLIAGLAQFYIYDFSELEPTESDRFEFDAAGGLGELPHLDDHFTAPDRHALLILAGDRPIGFALLNTHSHRGGSVERNMGEFFIARKYRRGGRGAEAVRQILAQYPGRWEVAVAERNLTARAFWPRAIEAAANVSQLEQLAGDGEHWSGPIWTFQAG